MQAQQFVQQARQRLNEVRQSLDTVRTENTELRTQIHTLGQKKELVLSQLAELYLPSFEPAVVARIKPLTGYAWFAQNDLQALFANEKLSLAREHASIEADPDFQNREGLLHEITGDLVVKEKELREQVQLLRQEVERYTSEPRLLQLIEDKYGTPEYQRRWWDLQYYSDWKWGDIYTERFAKQEFSEVARSYESFSRDHRTMSAERQAISARKERTEQLIKRHAEIEHRQQFHDEMFLQDCRRRLRDHLAHLDREQLYEWSKGDRGFEAAIKKLHGLEKQIEYLDELGQRQLREDEAALNTMAAKLQNKINKFSRPKNYHRVLPATEANAWLGDGGRRVLARRQKFRRNYETVVVFDRYDSFDYARDMLWWDLMTDGRIDGDFIPEVSHWRSQHGSYDPGLFSSAGSSTSSAPEEPSLIDPS